MRKITSNKTIFFFISAILLGAALRLLPHLPNFAPVSALALWGGVYLSRRYSWIVPLAAMVLSDIFIGFYEIKVMTAVYGSFLLIWLLGLWLKHNKHPLTITLSSLAGSFIFFFVTNFAVWAFVPWYPKNLTGLMSAYLLAVPFLRNTIVGDLFYTGTFFLVYELIAQRRDLFVWMKRKTQLTRGGAGAIIK